MKFRELVRLLEDNGFYFKKNSKHVIYTNGSVCVAVPHTRIVNGKTAHFILKYAGIKIVHD